ncbi:ubiquinone anaerobic biosynthesis accessory factor UbiT [Thalassolituus marinus]|uniref:SCP2 sterol-binding domain-containing protein n=1 Tax=Thalassolituus marinus TaxID=671053 RepID=A0ABS7ZRJ3_9GAMM|nr:SCP2 sterol-binding domain-containing protein [Thalassolituus marinus]MCA6063728.1 SCP2 sterol-binding domain-containing protein [Thalassolituus marinus]
MPTENRALPGISYSLLKIMRIFCQKAPSSVQKAVISKMLNRILKPEIKSGDFSFLDKRVARIEIPDLDFCFSVTSDAKKLQVNIPAKAEEVRLRADLQSILDIVNRNADPDTLFFHRRLLITGDTELGLEIKNLLDRIDPAERLPERVSHLLKKIQLHTP